MKRWLSEPMPRAEVMGWVLTMPALLSIVLMGYAMVKPLSLIRSAADHFSDSVPALLHVFLTLGAPGVTVLVALCALLPVLVLFTRQPAWVRLAAPLVCSLLVASMLRCYVSGFNKFVETATILHGEEAAEELPK